MYAFYHLSEINVIYIYIPVCVCVSKTFLKDLINVKAFVRMFIKKKIKLFLKVVKTYVIKTD